MKFREYLNEGSKLSKKDRDLFVELMEIVEETFTENEDIAIKYIKKFMAKPNTKLISQIVEIFEQYSTLEDINQVKKFLEQFL